MGYRISPGALDRLLSPEQRAQLGDLINEAGALLEGEARNKYRNVRASRACHLLTEGDLARPERHRLCPLCKGRGKILFDSQGEAGRYDELVLLQKAGQIVLLRMQVPFDLHCPSHIPGRAPQRVARYVADFTYREVRTGELVIEDYKGHQTREYILKKKWLALEHGVLIKEVSKNG